ncbi:DUF2513 domain-containing protein [Listeria valentina]|uniref:DUF2513 domain-containing protein n=1 Tax=Listeria valentina TaxID=2705293 RepID=UPI001430D7E7|nr:DUF2513 domain-containing protein [Listeria valentina]
MKLNSECVRDILLEIEIKQSVLFEKLYYEDLKKFDSYAKHGHDQFFYCLYRLKEAGYVDFSYKIIEEKIHFFCFSKITWEGHQFLDNIRDSAVWKNTKKSVSKFSSVSISFLSKVASNVLSQMIKNNLSV